MKWINDISELQYYNPIVGFPCYCELLVEPNDLTMQHPLPNISGASVSVIEVYSADGLTNYGDYTNYFTVTIGTNQFGGKYLQIQLNTFAPPMCEHLCWILKVELESGGILVFSKWTDRFCNVKCCTSIKTVTIESDEGDVTTHEIEPPPAWADCDVPIVRLETYYDCYDSFTGEYYGDGFKKVTNIRGRFLRLPRSIEKTISLNCKVQKIRSARLWNLEAWDYYPDWKMDEIELQLQAPFIKVNGSDYIYAGGTPFSKPNICQNIYLLNIELQECSAFQVIGCQPCIASASIKFFRLNETAGSPYTVTSYFSENKEYIGSTTEDVALYFQSQNGVLSVEVLAPIVECSYTSVIKVTSTDYIPTYLYSGGTLPSDRIYGVLEVEEVCETAELDPCPPPAIGSIVLDDADCDVPVIGTITLERLTPVVSVNESPFDVIIPATGSSFTDPRMEGYVVKTLVKETLAYNSPFYDKPVESDTLTSSILTFNEGETVTVYLQNA